jgi:peptidoglycan/LPS O-acetylase OafA/YrhL
MEKPTTQRSAALDTLRGIAVLLVLCRHMPLSEKLPAWILTPLQVLQRGGWAGVDLFFVLSGFLVSSILFREWQRSGKLHVGRFLVRRAFKIYPAFYVMLAAVFAWSAYHGRFPGWQYVASEGLFVQNYGPAILPHSWSLAVEEHFYLTLPLILWLLRGSREYPFRLLPVFILCAAAACLLMRMAATAGVDPNEIARHDPHRLRTFYAASHLRVDSLLFGVLIAWLYNFHRLTFDRLANYRWLLLILGVALFTPAFIYEIGPTLPLYTWGFTALYLGAGALLIACLRSEWSIRPLAMIGFYSYSIYLWHVPVQRILLPMVLPRDSSPALQLGAYFAAAIACGVSFALLVEFPALRFRERKFP